MPDEGSDKCGVVAGGSPRFSVFGKDTCEFQSRKRGFGIIRKLFAKNLNPIIRRSVLFDGNCGWRVVP